MVITKRQPLHNCRYTAFWLLNGSGQSYSVNYGAEVGLPTGLTSPHVLRRGGIERAGGTDEHDAMTHDDVFVYDVMSTNDLSVGSAQCLSYVCRGVRYHMGHGTARRREDAIGHGPRRERRRGERCHAISPL